MQAYEIKLEREADCYKIYWCNIVSGNSTLTIGLVYCSPLHMQWKYLQSTEGEDQHFLCLIQDSFLTQHC